MAKMNYEKMNRDKKVSDNPKPAQKRKKKPTTGMPKAGPVKITKLDGSVEVVPAHRGGSTIFIDNGSKRKKKPNHTQKAIKAGVVGAKAQNTLTLAEQHKLAVLEAIAEKQPLNKKMSHELRRLRNLTKSKDN